MDYSEQIQASIAYIENNLTERILLENLAKQTFISKYYYHRLFHQFTGETVMSFIRKRRLTKAAKELMESDIKIVDVALKYQFGSQETFSRAFKRMFEASPGEFRRANISILQYKMIDLCHRNVSRQWTMDSRCQAA